MSTTTNPETSGPSPDQSNLKQYQADPVAWCQKLINLGLSGRYGDPQKMIAVIGRGHLLGLDPYSSLECIYTVSGQTALGVDIMLALVERSGLLEDKRHEYTGKDDTRTCKVYLKRINRTEQSYSFSIAEAKQAQLIKPGGGWTKYPDSMLYARAMTFGLRREFPDVLRGIHSFEEMYVEPDAVKVTPIEPEQKPEGEEIKLASEPLPKPKRKRRSKAEILAAREAKALAEIPTTNSSSPPVTEIEDDIDIDQKIPVESKPINELLGRALNANVSSEELLGAAKALRLAFEERDITEVPEHKIKTMLAHWPVVLGAISREKAKQLKQEQVLDHE